MLTDYVELFTWSLMFISYLFYLRFIYVIVGYFNVKYTNIIQVYKGALIGLKNRYLNIKTFTYILLKINYHFIFLDVYKVNPTYINI